MIKKIDEKIDKIDKKISFWLLIFGLFLTSFNFWLSSEERFLQRKVF